MPATRRDVRLAPFWKGVRRRLASSERLGEILNVAESSDTASRIVVPPQRQPDRELPEGQAWGRIILLPALTLWGPPPEHANEPRPVAFLVKVEFADLAAQGYDVSVSLDAAQEEIFALLDKWSPGTLIDGSSAVLVRYPVYRYAPPDPGVLFDDDAGTYYTSAHYRCELAAAEP